MLSVALAFLGGWPVKIIGGIWSALAEAAKTPLGAAMIAGLVCFAIGDIHGSHSAKVASEKSRLEATIAAQKRDLRAATELAALAQSQARDADKAQADALAALEEIRAHAKDRNCVLSGDDARRLRRIH